MSFQTTRTIIRTQGWIQGIRFWLGNRIYDIIGSRGLYTFSTHYLADSIRCYSPLNVEGKTVVDIGCDYGNSVLYWWLRGATHITAFEIDSVFQKRLKNLTNIPMDFRGKWDGEYPPADILKIDIDGPESKFDLDKLDQYKQWAFAIHTLRDGTDTLYLREGLAKHGGRKWRYQENKSFHDAEEVWVKT